MATDEKNKKSERIVLVRTYSAGVHYGTLVSREGKEVTLANAKRVWRWRGANTLHELALRGPSKEYSRVSESVARVELTEAIEVLDCTPTAVEAFAGAGWAA
jgi:hypothetical protein